MKDKHNESVWQKHACHTLSRTLLDCSGRKRSFTTGKLPVPESVARVGSVVSCEKAEDQEGEKKENEDHGW